MNPQNMKVKIRSILQVYFLVRKISRFKIGLFLAHLSLVSNRKRFKKKADYEMDGGYPGFAVAETELHRNR
jgi:hypothetical protein